MRNLPPKRARWMRWRIGFLAMLLLAGAATVIRRAWDLQVERAPVLREMALEQYHRDIRLAPKRGTIYDRHGAELAVSVDVQSVWANPRQMRREGANTEAIASRLSSLLAVDRDVISRRLSSDRLFVWVKRRVSPQQAKAVAGLKLLGVNASKESRRFYPNRQLAAHVLGFANIDGVGIEGLELRLEDRLKGSSDAVPAIRDRRGVVVFSERLLDDRAAQGDDVTLTIDKTIQYIAERELELSIRTFEARAGAIVAMDPRNGEILALANFPTFNPNDPGSAPMAHRRNRVVTDRFEPGSTVKPFTVAGALSAGSIRPNQTIDCENGAMVVAEYTINDTSKHEHLTPAQILTYSSNIGTAKIGLSMGHSGLFRTFRRFGFGEVTGVQLPGETAGILRHHKRWYEMDAATIAFGQGMSANTLQLAMAMGAIANDGLLFAPMLVKRTTDARGEVIERTLPRVRRRVVPARIARLVTDMLTGVTGEGGTGREAAVDGYLVAGKTGTAQKADYVHGGYSKDQWSSSFVGFVPAHDPRIVIAVVVDEPLIAHYGGTVAGPVFRRVAEASLRHLGVPSRDAAPSVLAQLKVAPRPTEASAEDDKAPADPGPSLPELGEGEVRVPDLSGLDARRVMVSAHEAELDVVLIGSGLAVSQDPGPNTIAERGAKLNVILEPPVRNAGPETEVTADELPHKASLDSSEGKAGRDG